MIDVHKIDKIISDLDMDKLRASVNTGAIEPRPYQWLVYQKTAEIIRKFGKDPKPSYVTASVGAGKTIMIAMIASRFQDMGWEGMVIARQGEIIEQDAEELWNLSVKNSLFSASLGRKSTSYPLIAGTEGTIINGLFDEKDESGNVKKQAMLSDFTPRYILVDECLTGDALILTSEGPIRIDDKDLINKEIKCLNEDSGEWVYHKPKRVFNNGIKRVSSIKLESGEEIKCTSTHKLYSNGCWVEAGKLKAGMTLSLDGSSERFMTKLLRASVAVAKRFFLTRVKG